jgi:hypothetical protein
MKIPKLLLALSIFGKLAIGQDTIVQTNGTQIIAVVQEVGTSEIKYKKYSNKETSPVYDIAKYQVSMIKYADGNKDVFPPSAPVPAFYAMPMVTAPLDTTPPIAGEIFLGARIAPFNSYNGTLINNYWKTLFGPEGSNGTMKLNTGSTVMYDFFMGGTIITNKRNNWGYECQFDISPATAIFDSAFFPDGSHGSLSIRYMSINTAFEYLRGTDTSDRMQIGGELSLDVGLTTGTEHDVIYDNGTPYPTTVNNDYDGAGVGWHIAAMARYFVDKSKNIGFELRAGYRGMNVSVDNTSLSDNNEDAALSWSGLFASVGVVFQFRAHATVGYYDCNYY